MYFVAKPAVSAAFHYQLALCAVLFVIWPKSQYLRIGSPPLTFSILAIVTTLVMAYLSFSYGAKHLVPESEPHFRAWLLTCRVRPRGAIAGLALLSLVHTLFLLALALPLVLSAAYVSGVTTQSLGRALVFIVICTLSYRWLGILALCLWEQQEFLRYVVARVAFVLFVLGSAFFLPPVNPLLGLISMSFGDELRQVVTLFGREAPYADVAQIIHLLLLLASSIMVWMLIKGWITAQVNEATDQRGTGHSSVSLPR